jgi:hypothetical protein
MNIAIEKLKEAEVVLMNKIKRMKDGKPKWKAADELEQLREGIRTLEYIDTGHYHLIPTGSHPPY